MLQALLTSCHYRCSIYPKPATLDLQVASRVAELPQTDRVSSSNSFAGPPLGIYQTDGPAISPHTACNTNPKNSSARPSRASNARARAVKSSCLSNVRPETFREAAAVRSADSLRNLSRGALPASGHVSRRSQENDHAADTDTTQLHRTNGSHKRVNPYHYAPHSFRTGYTEDSYILN